MNQEHRAERANRADRGGARRGARRPRPQQPAKVAHKEWSPPPHTALPSTLAAAAAAAAAAATAAAPATTSASTQPPPLLRASSLFGVDPFAKATFTPTPHTDAAPTHTRQAEPAPATWQWNAAPTAPTPSPAPALALAPSNAAALAVPSVFVHPSADPFAPAAGAAAPSAFAAGSVSNAFAQPDSVKSAFAPRPAAPTPFAVSGAAPFAPAQPVPSAFPPLSVVPSTFPPPAPQQNAFAPRDPVASSFVASNAFAPPAQAQPRFTQDAPAPFRATAAAPAAPSFAPVQRLASSFATAPASASAFAPGRPRGSSAPRSRVRVPNATADPASQISHVAVAPATAPFASTVATHSRPGPPSLGQDIVGTHIAAGRGGARAHGNWREAGNSVRAGRSGVPGHGRNLQRRELQAEEDDDHVDHGAPATGASVAAGDGWRTGKKMKLEDAVDFRGTCQEMCPVQERETRRDISVFESGGAQPDGTPITANASTLVKKYQRAAAASEAQPPENVRPPEILEMTVDYLMAEILPITTHPFHEVYNFIADRTRCVRQDLTLQGCKDEDSTVHVLEKICRFHILSHHRLCGQVEVFDEKLNFEMLDNTFITLFATYEVRRQLQITSAHEAEFTALYMIRFASPHDRNRLLAGLPRDLLRSKEMKFSRLVLSTMDWPLLNYAKFFELVRKAPFLVACMMETKFGFLRPRALAIMNFAMGVPRQPGTMPLGELADLLGFSNADEASEYVSAIGLAVKEIAGNVSTFGETDASVPAVLHCVFRSKDFDPASAIKVGTDLIIESKIPPGISIADVVLGTVAPDLVTPSMAKLTSAEDNFGEMSHSIAAAPSLPIFPSGFGLKPKAEAVGFATSMKRLSSDSPLPDRTMEAAKVEEAKKRAEQLVREEASQKVALQMQRELERRVAQQAREQAERQAAAERKLKIEMDRHAAQAAKNEADREAERLAQNEEAELRKAQAAQAEADRRRAAQAAQAKRRALQAATEEAERRAAQAAREEAERQAFRKIKRRASVLDPLRAVMSAAAPVQGHARTAAEPPTRRKTLDSLPQGVMESRPVVALADVAIERANEAWTKCVVSHSSNDLAFHDTLSAIERAWAELAGELEECGEWKQALLLRSRLKLPAHSHLSNQASAKAYLLSIAKVVFRGGHRGAVPSEDGCTHGQFCHGLGFVLPSFVSSTLGAAGAEDVHVSARLAGQFLPHVALLGSTVVGLSSPLSKKRKRAGLAQASS